MDALARHRLLQLAGVAVPALRVPPRVELRELDVDEFEEGLEAADDLGHAEDDDLDDEEDDDADEEDLADEGPDRDAAARHRSLQLIGVDFRARSNPAPGRQVLTPEGARKYGLPIGSTILPGMRALTAAQQAAVAGLSDEDRPKYLQARREGATHAAAMKAAGGAPSRKSTARRPSEIQGPERKTLAADVVKRYESARRTGRSHAEAVDEIALALSEPGRDGQRDLTPAGARALVRDLLRENGVTTTTPAKKATPAVANKADIQRLAADLSPEHQREVERTLAGRTTLGGQYLTTTRQQAKHLRITADAHATAYDRAHRANPSERTADALRRARAEAEALRQIADLLSPPRQAAAPAEKATPAKAATPRIGPMGEPNALDRRMVRQYVEGKSLAEIAEAEGVSASTVHKSLTQQGLQLRPRGGARTPAKKAPAFDAAEVAGRVASQKTEADIVRLLSADSSLTAAKLQKVAEYLGIEVPEGTRAKTALQLLIAEFEAAERDLPGGFDAAAAPAKAAKRAPAKKAARTIEAVDARQAAVIDDISRAVEGLRGRTDLPKSDQVFGNPAYVSRPESLHDSFREGGWVAIADIRDALGEKYSRTEVDEALMRMMRDDYIRAIPIAQRAALIQRDRDAALVVNPMGGGGELHWFRIDGGPVRATTAPAKKAAAPAKAAKRVPAAQPDLTGARGLSTDPAVREVQIENRIREAFGGMRQAPGGWVGLAELRQQLNMADLTRAEVDDALRRLARQRGVRVAPFDNTRALRQVDHDAALAMGDSPKHMIAFGSTDTVPPLSPIPSSAPAKKAVPRAAKAAPAVKPDRRVDGSVNPAVARERIVDAGSADKARAYLDSLDMTQAQARALARDLGVKRQGVPPSTGSGRAPRGAGAGVADRADVEGAKAAILAHFADIWTGEQQPPASEGQFIRDLDAKRPTTAQLRELAASVGLEIPNTVRNSVPALESFLAQERNHPGLMAAIAALPVGPEPFDADAAAIAVLGGTSPDADQSIADLMPRLASYNLAELRAVARALGLSPRAGMTADQIRTYIAENIIRDRTRWSLQWSDQRVGAVFALDAATRHRTLQLLGIETRADVNPKPGDNNLRNYWVYGKGRAKWNTFTELRRHLLEHVGPERADRIAAQWFHLRYGFWPGDDRNRVRQGKPPRGDRIGPG